MQQFPNSQKWYHFLTTHKLVSFAALILIIIGSLTGGLFISGFHGQFTRAHANPPVPSNARCPTVAGKQPSSPGTYCAVSQERSVGTGSRLTVSLPSGTVSCASIASKKSSPTASCRIMPTNTGRTTTSTYSVSLTVDNITLAPGSAATLTATANTDVGPTPYFIEIFDQTTSTFLVDCGSGSSCSTSVSESSATTQNFIAYISSYGTTYPPPNIQATSNIVSVTWLGVTLSANPTVLGVGSPTTLTATANTDVGPTPYYIEVFDQSSGAFVAGCASGSSCATSVSQSTATTKTYIAYVSSFGTSNPPPNVQATSNTVSVAWQSSGSSIKLSSTFGTPSSTVKVTGTGFGISETVTITFDTTSAGNTTTSSTGTFSKKITVPKSAQPGNHTINARGLTSGLSASANFLVRTDWAQFGFAPQGGRYNNYENTINVSNVSGLVQDWTATGTGSPAVANGTVYVGSDKLYAFNASSGAQVWTASTGASIQGSPAVANGIVYVGSDKLYAFNASSGAQVWTASIGTNVGSVSSPTVANGVVYITTTFPGALYAFNAQTGAQLWSASPRNNMVSNPSVANSIVYIGVSGFQFGELEAFNATTGAQLWTALNTIVPVEDAPAVINGTLYIGSADDHVYALNPQTGAQIWAAPTSDWVISSPAVTKGVVYASTYDGKLDAFNASTGAQLWSMSVGGIASSAPAVANGVVYVTSNDGHLYALNAQTGVQLLSATTSVNATTSPTVVNGIVYFGSNDHNLYSFHLPGH